MSILENLFGSSKSKNAIQKAKSNKKRLTDFAQNYSLSEFLTYSLMLDDGVILHKDGALSANFVFNGPDVDSETDGSLDALSAKMYHSLVQLDEGWMVEMNLVSAQSPGYSESDHRRDMVSEIIDIERGLFFNADDQVYKTLTVLTFTYIQTDKQIEKLKNFAIDRSEMMQEEGIIAQKNKFMRTVSAVVDLLGAYNIHCEQLKGGELISYLFNCVNVSNHIIAKPKTTMFLDSYLAEQDVRTGIDIKIGPKNVAVLALDDLPQEYYPTILDELSQLTCEFRWSTRFIYMGMDEAERIFKKKVKEWGSKEIGFTGMLAEAMGKANVRKDEFASEMKVLADKASRDLSSGMKFGYMNSTIIVAHEDYTQLENIVNYITKIIRAKGFAKVRRETINATDAFYGSLPSHGGYNVRKIPVPLDFVVDIFPTTGIYQGQSTCPNPTLKGMPPLLETTTRGQRKFSFNLHYKDLGHTIIVGPSGTGKSTLLSMLIAQWLKKYPNARVIGADYNNGLLGTVTALNGTYFDVGSGRVQLSPFVGVDNEFYRISFLNRWLVKIYELATTRKANEKQKKSILESLERIAQMDAKDHNIIRFIAQLDDEEVQMAFSTFLKGLPHNILSGTGDEDIFNGDLVLFDKKPIIELDETISIPLLDYIYYKQRRAVAEKPAPTLMIIDEASFELKDEYLRDVTTSDIKTARHNDIAMILATQSNADFGGKYKDSTQILDNVPTRIYLPNDKCVTDKNTMNSYEEAGLNEQELKLIAYAQPKREYYVKQRLGNKLMRFEVGELALAFIGLTAKNRKDIDHMIALRDSGNLDWPIEWLEYCAEENQSVSLREAAQSLKDFFRSKNYQWRI